MAILVSQNNGTEAMLVFQTNPVGVELFSYVNAFLCGAAGGFPTLTPLEAKALILVPRLICNL